MKAGSTLGVTRRLFITRGPLHDPDAPDAIILSYPRTFTETEKLKTQDFEVHVVIDPLLARVLRPHQVDGVRFLYECVTGQKAENAFGCIMADEMVTLNV